MNNNEIAVLGGMVGTTFGAVGTVTQTNQILQTISLIITIIGALISMVIIPILNWWMKAKKDGKITSDEIKEGIDIASQGGKDFIDVIETSTRKEEESNEQESRKIDHN